MAHPAGFHRTRHGYEARFSRAEALLLREFAAQLVELLDHGATPVPTDPLEALVGMAPGEVGRPADPVLARLLPDAYRDDEPAAEEFRRFTEPELRSTKRGALRRVVSSLPAEGGRVRLDDEGAQTWLGALNDLRLALGTRLDVTERVYDELVQLADDDPRLAELTVYEWLGGLEESLVQSVAGW